MRAFGSTDLNELQFIAFTNICTECGHISWWDLSVEELENALNDPKSPLKIEWNYQHGKLIEFEARLSPEKKWIAQRLLEQLTAQEDANAKSE